MRLPISPYNLKIKELLTNGHWKDAIFCYIRLKRTKFEFTDFTILPAIMKASSQISFKFGQSMHACYLKQGYINSLTSVGNSILDFYMKWAQPSSGFSVFRSMMHLRDSISWNIVIHGYLDYGFLEDGLCFFMQGRVSGFEPNVSTLVLVAQGYRSVMDFDGGRIFHGYVLKCGFFVGVVSLQNCLLGMYADFRFEYAHQVFNEMCVRDVVSWSLMIGCCVQNEDPWLAVWFFKEMDVEPDGLTVVSVLKACSKVEDASIGRCIHGFGVCRGHCIDVFVANSLIDMYCRCGDSVSALRVFDEMTVKNIVSWNSILSGLVYNGMHQEGIVLAGSMMEANTEIDEVTVVNLLQLCKHICDHFLCRLIHSKVIRHRYESNTLVLNSLIDAYAKCNLIELAWRLFIREDRRDTVVWATMIGGFASCGMPDEALTVFGKMIEFGERTNPVVVLNLIEACTVSAELRTSKWVHGIAIRSSFTECVSVGTAIVDMYSKCGAVEDARKAFDQIPQKNIVSWSTMVSGYGINGRAQDALDLVKEMKHQGFQPNGVTALSVLAACNHGGLIHSGLSFFKEMVRDYGIQPSLEHYACVIDMLSRSGKLENAMEFIEVMPENLKGKASIWGAVLSACMRYKNIEIGEGAASNVLELEPFGSSGYLLASSLHASTGSWSGAAKMRRLVKERGVRVVAGYSLVRVGDKALRFVAGDKSTPQATESCCVVEELHKCMYLEDTSDEICE